MGWLLSIKTSQLNTKDQYEVRTEWSWRCVLMPYYSEDSHDKITKYSCLNVDYAPQFFRLWKTGKMKWKQKRNFPVIMKLGVLAMTYWLQKTVFRDFMFLIGFRYTHLCTNEIAKSCLFVVTYMNTLKETSNVTDCTMPI